MKNKKWWQKFKSGNTRLVILAIISFSAGISMMVAPEKTSHWIIRGVGLIWTLEAISYCLDLRLNYLKKQKEALTIHIVVKSSYCECTAPIVRTSVNMDEYCGNCGKDIEQ